MSSAERVESRVSPAAGVDHGSAGCPPAAAAIFPSHSTLRGPRTTRAPRLGGHMGGIMALKEKAEIVDTDGLRRIITRIAHEIVERNKGVEDLVLVGIRRRGVPLAQRMCEKITEFEGSPPAQGSLDITLYRDDLSTVSHQPVVGASEIPVDINNRIVVLVDDVLFTGRTVRAAMDALIDIR